MCERRVDQQLRMGLETSPLLVFQRNALQSLIDQILHPSTLPARQTVHPHVAMWPVLGKLLTRTRTLISLIFQFFMS